MMYQFFTYGFGVPATLMLVNLGLFWGFTLLKGRFAEPFKGIMADWSIFMKQGIPIPADYKRLDNGFVGEAVLTQPVFEARRNETVAR